MKRKLLFAALCAAVALCGQVKAQTNIIADWDGGESTAVPTSFGWSTSKSDQKWGELNGGNARFTTTYSGYKLEDGSSYTYSSSSDLSSKILWIRYNASGQTYTYTFSGLEPNSYYDFSALVGWHNNSDSPTFTIAIGDGTNTFTTLSKSVSTKQTLYSISTRFKTSSTISYTTDIKIVFTCNKTGDCMEAISALKLVNVVVKDELSKVISYAQQVNAAINNSTLASAITTAQGVYDNASATQAQVNDAQSTLRTAINTAIAAQKLDPEGEDISAFIFQNGFENLTVQTGNYATANSIDYSTEGWTLTSTGGYGFGAAFAYNGGGKINDATIPASDNAENTGNALGISVGWNTSQIYQSEPVQLPAGSYRFKVNSYNAGTATGMTSKVGVIPTGGSEIMSTKTSFTLSTWESDEISFTLDNRTEVRFQIGGAAGNNTSTNHAKVFFDNLTLTYFDPLKLAQLQWQDVHDALAALDATALPDAAESAITAELAKAVPTTTAEDVNTAKAAMQALIDSYAGIKTAYDKLNALISLATGEKTNSTGTKTDIEAAITTATTNIETRTSEADLNSDYSTLETARETYVTSGAEPTSGHVFDLTFKINDAAVTGTSAWGTARTGNGQQYDGAPDNTYMDIGWAQTYNMNQNVPSLPAGSYTLKAATRAKSSEVTSANIYVNQSNTALNKSTDTHRDNNTGGTLGNGWSWTEVEFVLLETGDVTVGFYGQTTGQGWAGADDFHLYYQGTAPMYKSALGDALASANVAYNNGANVGTGVFQIPTNVGTTFSAAIEAAQSVYDDEDATSDDYTDATTTLNTSLATFKAAELNAPEAGARYYLTVATSGHAKENNAIVVSLGATSDNNKTGYGFAANASPAAHVAGAYIFTKVDGKSNTYNISVERPEGTVYLTYGSKNNSAAGWATQQIQGTTDDNNKGEFKIEAATTANVFNIVNTEFDNADNYIDCQDGGSLYTDTNIDKKDFSLILASEAEVTVSAKSGKFGTIIFPFTPDVSEGFGDITFYSCEKVNETNEVELEEVTEPVANVPYLIKNVGTNDFKKELKGWGLATADSYENGLLTGVYTAAAVPQGSYVLQTPTKGESEGVQGFYKVTTDSYNAAPNRCYLTVGGSNVKAFFFGDSTDGIQGLEAGSLQGAEIYNLAGQRVQKAQRGVYIVNGKKVAIK